MTSSGTYSFNPGLVDIVIDSFDRCGIRPSAITQDHMFSAKRSINQVYSRWSNRAVNLWLIDQQVATINNSQQDYSCPAGTAAVFDVFYRQYALGGVQSLTPNLTTLISSNVVQVTLANHGLQANWYVAIPVYVSIAGLVLQGFYQVNSVVDSDNFTILAATAATSSTNGGAVPLYSTVQGSPTLTVVLPNHGFVGGNIYTVHQSTAVDGFTLNGNYTIAGVTDANTLTITMPLPAGSTATSVGENGGLMQIAAQTDASGFTDTYMLPLGRQEWAQLPTKGQLSDRPTSYWFDRQITPVLHIWPMPALSAPIELHYNRMRQMQDGNPENTQTPDLPYRAEEAFCAALAAHLAMKWAKDLFKDLDAYAKETWAEFSGEDRERANLLISPTLDGYFR